jgi:uncharacterized membrane protein
MTGDGASTPNPAKSGRSRLDAIDLLRGCVMVVMALDHTRDFFTNAADVTMNVNPRLRDDGR